VGSDGGDEQERLHQGINSLSNMPSQISISNCCTVSIVCLGGEKNVQKQGSVSLLQMVRSGVDMQSHSAGEDLHPV
jgi:hypothetical protein